MSPNISWHLKYEMKIIFIRYVNQNTSANVDKCKKNRFEGTRHKRGITDTIEMSQNTPSTFPGEIPSGMYIY